MKVELTIPCIYDSAMDFSEGLAAVKLDGKWGYIDKNGNEVIKCVYDCDGFFSEDLVAVRLNGKYGYLAKTEG